MSSSPGDAGATDGGVDPSDQATEILEQAAEMLAECTEAGRLARARKLVDKVIFVVADDDLVIAAVANYNVVVDLTERRIQHGCRDFRGQASERRLCKHVAATLLALEPQRALSVARELAEGARAPVSGVVVPWRFEVITRFRPG